MHAPFLGAPCGLFENMLSDLGACGLFVCAAFSYRLEFRFQDVGMEAARWKA